MEKAFAKLLRPWTAALIAGILYLAFLSRNPVVDAVYYAWCGRYGQELAHPHHLLYNYWLRGIMLITGGAGENTYLVFSAANALAGAACIGLLGSILQRQGIAPWRAFWLSLAVAGCWGFARFATDNEAYVLPILFSLGALRLCLGPPPPAPPPISGGGELSKGEIAHPRPEGRGKRRNSLLPKTRGMASLRGWGWLAGAFSAVGILFHQVQVWWALPMLWLVWRLWGIRPAVVFAAWHLLVPAGYWAVWALDVDQPFSDFMAGEFKAGGVKQGWGLMTVAKTAVQVVRSFLQLHETMFFDLPMVAVVSVPIAGVAALWVSWRVNPPHPKPLSPPAEGEGLSRFGLMLGLLLLAFSLFAQGNAEFLAGLPFAVVFWLGSRTVIMRLAPGLAASLWLWNSAFGHRIMAFYQVDPDREIAKVVREHPQIPFLISQKLEVDWWYAYLYGNVPPILPGKWPGRTYHIQWLSSSGNTPQYRDAGAFEPDSMVVEGCRGAATQIWQPVGNPEKENAAECTPFLFYYRKTDKAVYIPGITTTKLTWLRLCYPRDKCY